MSRPVAGKRARTAVHRLLGGLIVLAAAMPLHLQAAESVTTKPADKGEFPVQILDMAKSQVFRNPGKDSAQVLWSGNSPTAQMTITRVTMQPGAVSERHVHPVSEQTWIMEQGHGALLLADGKTVDIKAGELIRTPPNTTHGIENTGSEILIYTSITTPPEDMAKFYKETSAPK